MLSATLEPPPISCLIRSRRRRPRRALSRRQFDALEPWQRTRGAERRYPTKGSRCSGRQGGQSKRDPAAKPTRKLPSEATLDASVASRSKYSAAKRESASSETRAAFERQHGAVSARSSRPAPLGRAFEQARSQRSLAAGTCAHRRVDFSRECSFRERSERCTHIATAQKSFPIRQPSRNRDIEDCKPPRARRQNDATISFEPISRLIEAMPEKREIEGRGRESLETAPNVRGRLRPFEWRKRSVEHQGIVSSHHATGRCRRRVRGRQQQRDDARIPTEELPASASKSLPPATPRWSAPNERP